MQHIPPEGFEEIVSPIMEPYFEKERQRGREEAREQARQEAREEAREEARQFVARTLLRFAEKRFLFISSELRARIAAADMATLETWTALIGDAPSLDAVFGSGEDDRADLLRMGLQQQRRNAAAEAVLQVAEQRFSPVPTTVRERIAAAPEATLLAWLGELPHAPGLAEVFGNGDEDSASRFQRQLQEERQDALANAVLQIAEQRFAPVPTAARERIIAAPEATLLAWLGDLLNASSLVQVFRQQERQDALANAVLQIAEQRFSSVPATVRGRITAAREATLLAWLSGLVQASSLAQAFGKEEGELGAAQAS